jgi:hypothetical protein
MNLGCKSLTRFYIYLTVRPRHQHTDLSRFSSISRILYFSAVFCFDNLFNIGYTFSISFIRALANGF